MTLHGFKGLTIAVVLGTAACGVNTSNSSKVKITSIDPSVGSMTGGATINITGAGFDDGSGNASVIFGSLNGEVVSLTDSAISVKLPAGVACGPVDVQVTNGIGSAFKTNAFEYEGGSGPLTLTSISPNTGELAGNTTVTIIGSGFTGGVGILIGGAPLRDVNIVSNTELTGITPSRTTGGAVSISARNCASQASLTDAYVFITGLNGGVVEMNKTDYITTAFADPDPADYIDPYVAIVAPTADPMLNPLPGNNTCTLNYSPPAGNPLTFLDAGPQVHMQSGAQSIDLDAQVDAELIRYFYPQDDSEANVVSRYVAGGAYDFGIDGSAEIDGFAVAGALSVPAEFNVTAPNIIADPPATFSRAANLNFTWTPGAGGGGTIMQLFFIGYDNAAAPTNQVLYCLTDDDGAYLVEDLDKMSASTQAIVYVRKRKASTFLNPANGSSITSLTYLQKIGYIRLN